MGFASSFCLFKDSSNVNILIRVFDEVFITLSVGKIHKSRISGDEVCVCST